MMFDWQTVLVLVALIGASIYVGKSVQASIRPKSGCSSCQHNKARADDYA
jgi:hypothetical protein